MKKRKSLNITFVKTPAEIPAAIAALKDYSRRRYPLYNSQIEISEMPRRGYYIEIWLMPNA